jgi:hypothetical protein
LLWHYERMEPEERLQQISEARADYDLARAKLFREIRQGLTEAATLPDDQKRKLGPSAISNAARFTREYIAKIRDGKTGPAT